MYQVTNGLAAARGQVGAKDASSPGAEGEGEAEAEAEAEVEAEAEAEAEAWLVSPPLEAAEAARQRAEHRSRLEVNKVLVFLPGKAKCRPVGQKYAPAS